MSNPEPRVRANRPLIAISGVRTTASWGPWTHDAALLAWDYVDAVRDAGGEALVVPPGGGTGQIRRADALVLAGGGDIDARRYGQEPHPSNEPPDLERDESEFRLLAEALTLGLPVLGICRGIQLMAIAYGGHLTQHLPDFVDGALHHELAGAFGRHGVSLVEGTQLADVYGSGRLSVATYHHQAVADPGSLTISAWADDGIVEAVEDPRRPFVVGVQWHPEVHNEQDLFGQLVAHAARGSR